MAEGLSAHDRRVLQKIVDHPRRGIAGWVPSLCCGLPGKTLMRLLDLGMIEQRMTDGVMSVAMRPTRAGLKAISPRRNGLNADPALTPKILAIVVRQALVASGLSQRDLSKRSGIPIPTLATYLSARSCMPVTNLIRIARAIGLDAYILVAALEAGLKQDGGHA